MKFKAFHIDMNHAQFTGEYLRSWLERLAGLGYRQILWEVEDNVQWETCPQCVSPDAFTKQEFREILDYSESLGLSSIPLLQTLGHCEYVLRQESFSHFAELPDRIDQYCPRSPGLIQFLYGWLNEYLEIFGDVEYFHLGCDEAWLLGECDLCREYIAKTSRSELFVEHVKTISMPLIRRGIRPIIWADMLLRNPEAVALLPREIVLFDWAYEIRNDRNKVWDYKLERLAGPDEISETSRERFRKYLCTDEAEPDRLNIYYTADYLKEEGFDVVICPASSCWLDNVFSPRLRHHLHNCMDGFRKGMELDGYLLTSWTCHLFPWEMQIPCIEAAACIEKTPDVTLESFVQDWALSYLGLSKTDATKLLMVCDILATRCMMGYNASLGLSKVPQDIPLTYVIDKLAELQNDGTIDVELSRICEIKNDFAIAVKKLEELKPTVKSGYDFYDWWCLNARNLLNRAAMMEYLLRKALGQKVEGVEKHLAEMLELKEKTNTAYQFSIKPFRRKQMISWLYDSCLYSVRESMH